MAMADIQLKLFSVPVIFLSGVTTTARAEGNNAAWHCECGDSIALLGRCYFQFGHSCHTVCPTCNRKYRVIGDAKKRAANVLEY
jgi:hypothetical protein